MATERSFVEFVCEQLRDAGAITSRKMFGEYAIYHQEKCVALVCDNQFFVKPTDGGARIIGNPVDAPPFPQAKPYFLIADLDDPEWLAELIVITARELPEPKPKAKTKRKAKSKAKAKAIRRRTS